MRHALRDPVLYLALVLGSLVRLLPVLASDFPLNDGGLFAAYIDQLAANGLAPPATMAYNGTDIAFVYPPLGFYLGAGLQLAGFETLDILRFVPAILAILTIPAWYLLARDLLGATIGATAALVYGLVPQSFEWLVSGGGITRALGVLLVLLALRWALAYLRTGSRRHLVTGGVTLGLGLLSHPEIGLSGAASVVLFAIIERAGWRRVAGIAAVSALTVSPWLVLVVVRHGLAPITAVGGSRIESYAPTILEIVGLSFTHELLVPLGAVLGAIGLFVAATSGRGWLIGWIGLAILVAPSSSPALVMLAWSAAAGLAVHELVLPRLGLASRRVAAGIGLAVMLLASAWSPVLPQSALVSVPADVRHAMAWMADNVEADADVAVVTGAFWARDATAEWFPYLTGLTSVGTVQGQEFSGGWAEAVERHRAILRCARRTADCLTDAGADIDYVFIPKGPVPGSRSADCCLALRESLRAAADVVYDGPGATVAAADAELSPGRADATGSRVLFGAVDDYARVGE